MVPLLIELLLSSMPAGRLLGRRAVCAGFGAAAASTLCPPRRVSAAPEPVADLRQTLSALDTLVSRWEEATSDCRFGEIQRKLLETASKERLLEEASTFSTFNKEKNMDVMCKRSTRLVRAVVDGPGAKRAEAQLRSLAVIVTDEDRLVDLVETWAQARSAASAAAFASQTGDLSALNTYKQGTDDGGSENLLEARRNVVLGADTLRQALGLVG